MTDILPAERFADLIAAYGANLDRWPDSERAGAVRRLVDSDAARAAWREAADLDTMLDSLPAPAIASERVAAAIAMADSATKPQPWPLLRQTIPYAAAAAIALVVGLWVPSPLREGPAPQQVSVVALAEAPDTLASNTAESELAALALIDAEPVAEAANGLNSAEAFSSDISLSALPLL